MSVFALDKLLKAIRLNDDNYDDDDYYGDEEFDDDYDDDDDDGYDDGELEEKPKKKFFNKFSSKKNESEEERDDDYDDDLLSEPDEELTRKSSSKVSSSRASASKSASSDKLSIPRHQRQTSKITPMRSPKKSTSGTASMEVCVIKPVSMEDTRDIARTLMDNCTVILNLEGIDIELAQRIIDFTSGAGFALGGTLTKVSDYIFVLGPANVGVTGDLQNILNNSVPSVRAGYY
ncbi:MAG: cell division protein SepF [Eubacteriales bacterium]|nr:cell division protein SepF [Eubacteriales bacterium]